MVRRVLVVWMLCLLAACATLSPTSVLPSIQRVHNAHGGVCTAWAVRPTQWVTAAHCTQFPLVWDDGRPAALLDIDTVADLALLDGPAARPLPLSAAHPQFGDPVTVYGYGMGRAMVLLAGIYNGTGPFFTSLDEFLIGGNSGMPGMSGGPILARGRVVSIITGGGVPTGPTHMMGTGVPLTALRTFVARPR